MLVFFLLAEMAQREPGGEDNYQRAAAWSSGHIPGNLTAGALRANVTPCQPAAAQLQSGRISRRNRRTKSSGPDRRRFEGKRVAPARIANSPQAENNEPAHSASLVDVQHRGKQPGDRQQLQPPGLLPRSRQRMPGGLSPSPGQRLTTN